MRASRKVKNWLLWLVMLIFNPSIRERIHRRAPSVLAVIGSAAWWRHQVWMVATEVLSGFLAALGLLAGIAPSSVAAGLALAYSLNACGVWVMRARGYGRALWTTLAWSSWVAAGLLTHAGAWWAMAICLGALLPFRDQHTTHSLVSTSVRAERRQGKSINALTLGAIFSTALLALGLTGSGIIVRAWPLWPQTVALIACLALMPLIFQKRHAHHHQISGEPHQQMDLLLRLCLMFNAINFLGRRIVLPGVMVAIARHYGDASKSLPVLGACLGLMGVIGILARIPGKGNAKNNDRAGLIWGAQASLAGWCLMSSGILLWGHYSASIFLVLILGGWALLEITNRTWVIGYMDHLRNTAIGGRRTAARAHRTALQRFMIYKSVGGATGCGMAALLPAAATPALLMALIGGCWIALRHLWADEAGITSGSEKVAEPL
jgi:hypothetical protein